VADRDNAARIHLVEFGDARERRCPREPVAPECLAEVEMRVEDDQSEGGVTRTEDCAHGWIADPVIPANGQRHGGLGQNCAEPRFQAGIARHIVAGNDVDVAGVRHRDMHQHVEIPVEAVAAIERRVFADLLRRATGRSAAEGRDAVVRHPDHHSVGR
jgi:hypothetical protein